MGRLYESLGFEACGRIPKAFRLKNGNYEDEIVMTKALLKEYSGINTDKGSEVVENRLL